MRRLRSILNPRATPRRVAIKSALLVGAALLVLYPNPLLLATNGARWASLDALPDRDADAVAPLVEQARALLQASDAPDDPESRLRAVEQVVGASISYEWDWVVWGAVDYVPTPAEVIDKGREDCDGRAVLAAAILRRMGHDARIVSDLAHVWVRTPDGDAMSPRTPRSGHALVASRDGGGAQLDWRAVLDADAILHDWPGNLAYAASIFPLWREALLVGATWIVTLAREPRWRREALILALLLGALALLRLAGAEDRTSGAWAGIACLLFAGALASRPAPVARAPDA